MAPAGAGVSVLEAPLLLAAWKGEGRSGPRSLYLLDRGWASVQYRGAWGHLQPLVESQPRSKAQQGGAGWPPCKVKAPGAGTCVQCQLLVALPLQLPSLPACRCVL